MQETTFLLRMGAQTIWNRYNTDMVTTLPEGMGTVIGAISAYRNLANIYSVSILYAKSGRLLWFLQM